MVTAYLQPEKPRAPDRIIRDKDGKMSRETWELPIEEAFLELFLTDIFENNWQGIRFGPLIEGAAYEMKCPKAPDKIAKFDGYLTVMFGKDGHFHLCIGDNMGPPANPTPEALRQRRKPSGARLFRGWGRDGKPVTWGFEMENGHQEPMMSIFFPNPFIEDDDSLTEVPDFSRLATWRRISKRYLGRDAEAVDAEGKGFGGHS